jgi:hypothetical protein
MPPSFPDPANQNLKGDVPWRIFGNLDTFESGSRSEGGKKVDSRETP